MFPVRTLGISISLWIKLDEPGNTNGIFGIQWGAVGDSILEQMNFPALYSANGLLAGRLNQQLEIYSSPHFTNGWHHLVVTVDHISQKLYIDGEEKALVGIPMGEMPAGLPEIQLGAVCGIIAPDVWSFMKGAVDDVRIYGKPLFPHQIKALSEE